MTHEMQVLLLLVCGGAFLWGVGNVLKSHYLKTVHADVMVVGTMVGGAVFSITVEILWNGVPHVDTAFWIPFSLTAFLNIWMANLNVRALQLEREAPSVVISLASTMPGWAITASWFILREWPTMPQILGILVVSLGAYTVGLKGQGLRMPAWFSRFVPERYHHAILLMFGPWFRIFQSKGARFALLQAWLGAVAISFDKEATLKSSPMVFTGSVYFVVALFTYGWSRASGRWKEADHSHLRLALTLGLLVGLYTVLLNAAYFYALAVNVGGLKRLQIVFTALLAWVFLHEQHGMLKVMGAVLVFLGAMLIAL